LTCCALWKSNPPGGDAVAGRLRDPHQWGTAHGCRKEGNGDRLAAPAERTAFPLPRKPLNAELVQSGSPAVFFSAVDNDRHDAASASLDHKVLVLAVGFQVQDAPVFRHLA
jgi:hypothetical protein